MNLYLSMLEDSEDDNDSEWLKELKRGQERLYVTELSISHDLSYFCGID